MEKVTRFVITAGILCVLPCVFAESDKKADKNRITIYKQNRYYWQYKGEPVLLLGGSVEDNLFQIPKLKEHLDLLKNVGGNYVRCTMSCRDEGNVWPFAREGDKYDLDKWNDQFWDRFENFLKLTSERDIIVQIEVWATFDYYRDVWARNPFNPQNNINYTAEESGLPLAVNSHPTQCENNFFWSVPAERNKEAVLKYQRRFVDKMLSYSLKYGNVLYCMDNETSVTPQWGWYWSKYIKEKAKQAGVEVHTTEMWDAWDLAHDMHKATFDKPEIFSFVDISQNNHQKGQAHWVNAQKQRNRIAGAVRPLNNVKIYGSDVNRFGESRDGIERFWRNVIGGLASARFHRPDSGLGLSEPAQIHIKSARMLADKFDFFDAVPDSEFKLLAGREENEAYVSCIRGKACAVYFPDGGEVELLYAGGNVQLRWLEIEKSAWREAEVVRSDGKVKLTVPGKGHWAVVIRSVGN